MTNPRSRFEIPSGVYLLSHSAGCLPTSARSAGAEFFDAWAASGGDAWGSWIGGISAFREALARLLGGEAQDFCPQANLSSGLTKLIGALPQRPGRSKVIYSELDFPSCGFVCAQSQRLGYQPQMLAAQGGDIPLSAWDAAIGSDTQLVHITHVLSENSRQLPVAEICALARARGAYSVVDIAQSVGVVPITISDWRPDFITGSCLKWLCGGPGAGYLWVNPALADSLAPSDIGWFSHARPFEFDITRFEYAQRASRFWGGTPSVLPFAIAAHSIAEIVDIGLEQIRAVNLKHTSRIIAAALEYGIAVSTPLHADQRGGTVALRFADSNAAAQALQARGIRCDSRPRSGVRLSPHVFNTAEEIEMVVEELRSLTGSSA